MDHAITIGGLLLGIGIIVGLLAVAVGALMIFAGGMSDAPSTGDDASKKGCVVLAIGALILGACILKAVL